MTNTNFRGHCYASDDLETLQSAAPEGTFLTEPVTGAVTSPYGMIIEPTPGWLVQPEYTPDPEADEPVLLSPGTRPPAVCLLVPADAPIPALDAFAVAPLGWQGWA